MATSWSLDYCLACDRQTTGDAYCSQACRLADLETASASSSPSSPPLQYSATARSTASSGLYLSPAFDFAAHRSSPPSGRKSAPSPSYSQFPYTLSTSRHLLSGASTSRTQQQIPVSPKTLTPSSSETSLTSLTSLQSSSSGQGSEGISKQARDELREYTNSFDQVRDMRRRMTGS